MKAKFILILFLTTLTFINCKNDKAFKDFRFNDKPKVINCNDKNLDAILNEALYSFEDDISKFYGKGKPNLNMAYSQFMRYSIGGRVKYGDIVSPHTVKVFDALKNYDLWDATNPKSYLNYNSPFFKCLAENIKDKNLKTTLNALVSTNSMSPKLFSSPLMTKYRSAISDKYLASYMALDLYYAKLFDIDLSNVKEKPMEEEKVDFNKTPNM